jgi:hypothetical protein
MQTLIERCKSTVIRQEKLKINDNNCSYTADKSVAHGIKKLSYIAQILSCLVGKIKTIAFFLAKYTKFT